MRKLLLVWYMLTVYITWFLLDSFSLTLILSLYIFPYWSSFLICSILLILLIVFSMICLTPLNAVVLQNILRLFPFSYFTTNVSSLQFLISFLLLLPHSYWIWMSLWSFFYYLYHFGQFRLTSFLFTPSSSSFILTARPFSFHLCLFFFLCIYFFNVSPTSYLPLPLICYSYL